MRTILTEASGWGQFDLNLSGTWSKPTHRGPQDPEERKKEPVCWLTTCV